MTARHLAGLTTRGRRCLVWATEPLEGASWTTLALLMALVPRRCASQARLDDAGRHEDQVAEHHRRGAGRDGVARQQRRPGRELDLKQRTSEACSPSSTWFSGSTACPECGWSIATPPSSCRWSPTTAASSCANARATSSTSPGAESVDPVIGHVRHSALALRRRRAARSRFQRPRPPPRLPASGSSWRPCSDA